MPAPILRRRLLSTEWVAVAPDRAQRPHLFAKDPPRADADPGKCPFCRLGEGPPIRAVANRFPALTHRTTPLAAPARGHELYAELPSRGIHEVLVEAREHIVDWRDLSASHLGEVFELWRRRLAQLESLPDVAAVALFKNQGARAGASIPHVHSQIAALPLIPPRAQVALDEARRYHERQGCCALCDVIAEEERTGARIVAWGDHIVALAPFGSRAAFETWLMPRRHAPSFSQITREERLDLAQVVCTVLTAWGARLGKPDFNLILRSVPFAFAGEPYYHWHLEMLPRTGQVAGFELSSGMYINAVPSEEAATLLRESILQGK